MSSISEAEAEVMEVLWAAGVALCAEEVAVALRGQQDWQIATIKTLLNRLLNKGAIRADKEGRRYRYSAVLRRQDWATGRVSGLVDRLFGGSLAPLVLQFGSERRLKPEDVEALRSLLREYDGQPTKSEPEQAP